MAEVQTAYVDLPPIGVPGMLVNGEAHRSMSRTVEDAAGIAFGKAAFQGTGDHGITATPTAGKFIGIVIADHGKVFPIGGTADVIGQYGSASLATTEPIFVTASVTVAPRDQVYVTSAGAFTNVVGSNIILPGWQFDATASAAGVVPVVKR
jgi:hypothetical protein